MKQGDIKKCCFCDKGVAHSNQILSTAIQVERMALDPAAVQRRHGLELVMGGGKSGAALAAVMGPDEDLLKPLGPAENVMVCDLCAMSRTVAELWEVKS